ncbi:hypothetical protein GA0115250_14474 [Streptomyces sp. BvitLS-983]|nr:hypothetical protein GA0115250_14474 [Streptomyces sp. BvitLS-983]
MGSLEAATLRRQHPHRRRRPDRIRVRRRPAPTRYPLAHQHVTVQRPRPQLETRRARLPITPVLAVRTVTPSRALRPGLPPRASRSGRARGTHLPGSAVRPVAPSSARFAVLPVHAIGTRGPGLAGRPRLARLPVSAVDPVTAVSTWRAGNGRARLATGPGRARDRSCAQLLHLRGELIPGLIRALQLPVQDHEPSQGEGEDSRTEQCDQPRRHIPPAPLLQRLHSRRPAHHLLPARKRTTGRTRPRSGITTDASR